MRAFGLTVTIAATLMSLGGMARAADIRVLAVRAPEVAIRSLAADFAKESGHQVTFTIGSPAVVMQKIKANEVHDAVIVSEPAMDELDRDGIVNPESRVRLANTGIGVAVRDGAPKPDIGTPEALKQALLSTKSLTYVDPAQGGTSGIHFAGVLQRLGIADAVKSKTTLVPGGYPAELVAKGEVEMVVHQISEIIPVKGVTLVGPLPKDLQKITVYGAGVAVASTAKPEAKAFVTFLARPDFKPKLAAAGLDYKE